MTIGDYCTQIDPAGYGGMRCGPACLASVALSNGWESDPWELTKRIDAEIPGSADGTTSEDLIRAAEAYELDGSKWYAWSECTAQLAAGGAVLCLLDNRYLSPRPYPSGSSWNAMHWIRACAVAEGGKMVYAYDPLTYMMNTDGTVYQNPTVVTQDSLWRGIMATGYPEAGVILISKLYRNLNEFK